jgi:peptidoglycan hydrolase-like protein with peptidoglycan-binding domain
MRRGGPGRLELKKILMPCIFALSLLVALPAFAQTKPPTPPKPTLTPLDARKPSPSDVSPQARAAFLALAEPDRKAAQDALGWLGFYNGVVDGSVGKRTLDALAAYQQSVGANADGIVTPAGLAALKDGAAKAKAAVGFRLIDDSATGLRIGAPTKLLDKRESGTGAASLTSKDGAVGLYTKETTGDLAALYKSLSADSGSRKVTYKYLKPDAFFVTAGEDGDNKFYRRYAVGEGGKLRGFAFLYPKARAKALDPVALAVANSFDPFPSAPLPPVAPSSPTPTPTPEPPKLTATALVVAPDVAVTALDPAQCKAPTVSGKPVRFLEGNGPLARLGGEFGAGAAAIPIAQGGGELVALSLAGAKPRLEVTLAASVPGTQKVIAALGPAASGAPLFDRQGRLVAFVGPVGPAPQRAGVTLAATHAILKASALGEAVAPGGADGALTAPAIARLRRGAIVGVFCAS